VSAATQLVAQLGVVVDLAAVDHAEGAPTAVGGDLGGHRLLAAGEVDDGKSSVSERDVRGVPGTSCVRTATRHRLRHRVDDVLLTPQIVPVGHPSGDAAHGRSSPEILFIPMYFWQ
jgi:hypothetical protein